MLCYYVVVVGGYRGVWHVHYGGAVDSVSSSALQLLYFIPGLKARIDLHLQRSFVPHVWPV
jgi:hypothetical protein